MMGAAEESKTHGGKKGNQSAAKANANGEKSFGEDGFKYP